MRNNCLRRPKISRAMRNHLTTALLLVTLADCAGQPRTEYSTSAPDPDQSMPQCDQVGVASWYRGSSKDSASLHDLVAAHRSLPLGTFVRVIMIDTGQSIVVRINDRGPFGRGRIIDLSKAAAIHLGIIHDGVARVRLEPVGAPAETCPFRQAAVGFD